MTITPTSPIVPLFAAGGGAQSGDPVDAGKAREVARDLEALLVSQLIAAMRRTVPESGLLAKSASRRTLDDAFDHQLARALVADGSLGLAQQIEAQLLARQGARASASAPTAPLDVGRADVPAVARATKTSRAVVTPEPGAVRATTVGATVERTSPAAERVDARLELHAPLDAPRVTSHFGMRSDPLTGEHRFHAGVDLAAPAGTAIRVAADGDVVFSGRRGAAGNLVEVRHPDGSLTSYAHAERTLVGAGQRVVAGDIIATVGSSGRSTGPHLHFSVRRDGQAMDPAAFIPELGAEGRRG